MPGNIRLGDLLQPRKTACLSGPRRGVEAARELTGCHPMSGSQKNCFAASKVRVYNIADAVPADRMTARRYTVSAFFILIHRIRTGARVGGIMKNQNTKRMTLFALFLAIEIMLFCTPFGFLQIGPLAITLMHVPVIAASILLSVKEGMALGLVFGLCSMIKATMAPGITSFVFSPFVTIGGISGNWSSLLIALVPRILTGYIPGALYSLLQKKGMNQSLGAGLAAMTATMVHTVLVLGGIWVFFGEPYAAVLGSARDLLMGLFGMTVLTNSLPETVVAGLVMAALVKAIRVPSVKAVRA